jgi:alcohol dehydrogenase (NADP+)
MKSYTFRNGNIVEAIALGTWKSSPGEVGKAVKSTLETGYGHIDCAAVFGNEAEVGQALEEVFSTTEISRENIHITSKLWNTAYRKQDVVPALFYMQFRNDSNRPLVKTLIVRESNSAVSFYKKRV